MLPHIPVRAFLRFRRHPSTRPFALAVLRINIARCLAHFVPFFVFILLPAPIVIPIMLLGLLLDWLGEQMGELCQQAFEWADRPNRRWYQAHARRFVPVFRRAHDRSGDVS